ncbi:hypothetical protein Q8A67_010194 [Cirrhinus molitorella]|uniref:Ig-like domain-containing protein n=1 Tax=Cirrhinus molitorella TaxID=172907 RepID=A0AA88Q3M3_9TELE|nr:hypothetical protein Q8A67_010194 [Cirrhinus molitorella]
MLICSAYDFYPKHIKLTWMRDDKEVTADVTSIEELANGDWYYQIHSHLEYFPKPGEKISCVVEHASSNRPMIYHWVTTVVEKFHAAKQQSAAFHQLFPLRSREAERQLPVVRSRSSSLQHHYEVQRSEPPPMTTPHKDWGPRTHLPICSRPRKQVDLSSTVKASGP